MQITAIESKRKASILNVAAYARVSTLGEDQKESFDSQREYYEALIKNNPKWNFAGVYADRGLSGTTQHRPEFQRLVRTAKEGQIDLILVKSISRFARNAVDTQKVVHDLKGHNVEVYFEEQNLSSFNRNAELALNMMAMVAESESRSISQNTQWALKKLAEKGIRHLGKNRVFAYTEIDGVLTPNENAKRVVFIYESYVNGMGLYNIAKALNKKGVRTATGGPFSASEVKIILGNEIYCGDRLIQKQAHQNFLTKKPDGYEFDSIFVEDAHEAIVSKKLWEKAKKKLEEKAKEVKQGIYRQSNSHFLFGRIYCGDCGEQMRRITYGSNRTRRKVWKCWGRTKGSGCINDVINESELFEHICKEQGIAYEGSWEMKPENFEDIEKIEVFSGGRVVITRQKSD